MSPAPGASSVPAPPAVLRLPAFADNYIWLLVYAPGKAAAIDPGDAAPVRAALAREGLTLTHILNTHWHADHTGGNLALQAETGADIVGPAHESHPIPGLTLGVADGDTLALGNLTAHVLFVGAHTAGHIAWHFPAAQLLFPGDTLFAMGCGRIFEGTPADMFRALHRLAALPPATRVHCAHEYTLGNARFALTAEPDNPALVTRAAATERQRAARQPTVPFLLADELATNPFVRAADAEALGRLRARKDAFRG